MTKEQLAEFMPDGVDKAKWDAVADKIVELHDVEVNGLKNNEASLKKEKTDAVEKYRTEKAEWEKAKGDYEKNIADSKTEYEKQLAEFTKKLADNSPDAVKNEYEKRIQEMNTIYSNKEKEYTSQIEKAKSDYETQLTSMTEKVKVLESGVFKKDCYEEFDKAIKDKNLDPSAIEDARNFVLGENCSKFARHDMGSGNSLITRNGDSKDIASSVAEFLQTSLGKRCVLNTSTGGGADGSKDVVTSDDKKKMTREQFLALSPKQRRELIGKVELIE